MRRPVARALLATLLMVPLLGSDEGVVTRSAMTPAGEAVDGVALSITLAKPAFKFEEPIFVRIEIRNVGADGVTALGPGWGFWDRFHVVERATGIELSATPDSAESSVYGMWPVRNQNVPAGQSWFGSFDLTHFVHFRNPGAYYVRVERPSAAYRDLIRDRVDLWSNTALFSILP